MEKDAILGKLNFILEQDKKDETLNDQLYKYQLNILFKKRENNSFDCCFVQDSQTGKIIFKIIEILYFLFHIKKDERENLYNSDVKKIENKELNELLVELNVLQNYQLEINTNLIKLFNVVSELIETRNKDSSICQYIDSALLSLSFNTGFDKLLKYQMFSLIIQCFLQKYNIPVSYYENEINVNEDKSIDLILNLFTKNEVDLSCVIQSIIILNYNSLNDVISNCTTNEIFSLIENISQKLKDMNQVGKISVCVERIIEMFVDEIEYQKDKKKVKNKKNKKYKKKKKQEKTVKNMTISEITPKLNNGNTGINIDKNTNEINKPNDPINKIDDEIKGKNPNNELNNPKLNIINLFNNIVNKINMGNEVLKNDIENVKHLILDVVENNDKLSENVEKLNGEMEKKNQEINRLNKEYDLLIEENKLQKKNIEQLVEENKEQNKNIDNLEQRIENLENDCDELKYIISKIQFRDLSKNFLRCFNSYLLDEDFDKIKANKQLRGEIISNRINKLFPNADKERMKIIQDLLKYSSDLINKGNYLTHSITIEEYENEIKNYKEEKKIKQIQSPVIFCFVYFLEISEQYDESFDNSYSFLNQCFTRNLRSFKSKNLLENYLKN